MKLNQEESLSTQGNKKEADIQPDDKEKKDWDEVIDVHSKGLDDLVNVNSLFTIAVFIGLASANPNGQSLENRPECKPDPLIAKKLIFYEVVSFGFFLVSSLAAKSLKILLNFHKVQDKLVLYSWVRVFLDWYWRKILLSVSFWSSVAGIITLTISMVNLVQMRIGRMHCGSVYTERSVKALIIMDTIALSFLYLPPFLIASFARYQGQPKGWRNLLKNFFSRPGDK